MSKAMRTVSISVIYLLICATSLLTRVAQMTAVTALAVYRHFMRERHPSNLGKTTMESSSSVTKSSNPTSSVIYGLGFVGALIYFMQAATSFWIGVLAFFKAVFWPAFLVYYILDFLKK